MSICRTVVICTLFLVAWTAQSQYSNEPYFDAPGAVRHTHALNLMEVRLTAVTTLMARGELTEEMAEVADDLLAEDLPRVAGTLRQVAPGLQTELEEALREFAEDVETENTDFVSSGARRAARLVSRARHELLGEEVRPEIAAVAMSRLLLGEPGVAEGYEEAVLGEGSDYTLGWSALQEVKDIWMELAPGLTGRSAEVREALDELDELLPDPAPPLGLSGDPEAAEEPAHRITSLLEGVTDSNLYPERELGRVAMLGAEQAADACAAFGEGDGMMGLELSLAVQDAYSTISGTVGLLASESHERVEAALRVITGDSGEEDGVGEAVESSPTADPLKACKALRQGLEEVAAAFGE